MSAKEYLDQLAEAYNTSNNTLLDTCRKVNLIVVVMLFDGYTIEKMYSMIDRARELDNLDKITRIREEC